MFSELNERQRRLWAASEARAIGHGGIVLVSRATGIDRRTIMRGIREMEGKESLPEGRIRKIGGGRKKKSETNPNSTFAKYHIAL